MSGENQPTQVLLSQEQKEIIVIYSQKFNDWVKNDDGKQTIIDHRDHENTSRKDCLLVTFPG